MKKITPIQKRQRIYFALLTIVTILLLFSLFPLHELFHAIPCMVSGNTPIIHFAKTSCSGMEQSTDTQKFMYLMGPYIANTLIILIFALLIKKYKALKYLILIPIMDIIFNFFSIGPVASDFDTIYMYLNPAYASLSKLFLVIPLMTLYLLIQKKVFQYETYLKDNMPFCRSRIFDLTYLANTKLFKYAYVYFL